MPMLLGTMMDLMTGGSNVRTIGGNPIRDCNHLFCRLGKV
jgi:hypothetical protein